MYPGERFEHNCLQYLKNNYEKHNISFQLSGGMDSTTSDIAVFKNNEFLYYIEAKMGMAQCGQFVILPDKERNHFFFSPKNKSEENIFTNAILQYINQHYSIFLEAGTAGEDILIDNAIFSNWIINYYKNKGVNYFITYSSEYIIFPVEKFPYYFTISATARNKGSGSTEPARKNWNTINDYVTSTYEIIDVTSVNENKKNRLLVYSEKLLDKETFLVDEVTYKFSSRSTKMEYEIRKLNRTTKNTTVIFSISINSSQLEEDLISFERSLL